MDSKQSVALLILGMHRSGTSALTRMLNLLGVELGGNLQAGDKANVPGYWEPADFIRIHEEILDSAGSSWDDWTQFDTNWFKSQEANNYKIDIINLIKQEFSNSGIFAVKDPRVCRFSSLWFDALDQLEIHPIYLLPTRNPLEVIASLHRRNGFPSVKSQLLWLRHVLDVEFATRGFKRLITEYDQLLTDWRLTARKISSNLDLVFPLDNETVNTKISLFLQKSYRNHEFTDEIFNDDTTILEWVKLTYHAIQALSDEGEKGEIEKREIYHNLDKVREEFNCFSDKYGAIFRFEKEQIKKAELYAKELKKLGIEQQSEHIRKQAELIEQQNRNISEYEQLKRRLLQQTDIERARAFQLSQYANTAALQLECVENSSTWIFSIPLRFLENNYPKAMHNILYGLACLLLPISGRLRETLRMRQKARVILKTGLFDEIFYITGNPEVTTLAEKPLYHWLEVGWKLGFNPNWLFDTTWYLQQRLYLSKLQVDPLTHYIKFGGEEGNDPSPIFDSKWYKQQHPEVNESGLSPLAHFFKYGAAQMWSPCPFFDYGWYLDKNSDVSAMKIDPFQHYIQFGCFEGRDPHQNFSNDWYLKNYLSSSCGKVCPLVHYFTVGKKSNLPTSPHAC